MVREYKRPMYSQRHYENTATMLGKNRAPKFEVDMWVKAFRKDNPRFKESVFRKWVEDNRPKAKK